MSIERAIVGWQDTLDSIDRAVEDTQAEAERIIAKFLTTDGTRDAVKVQKCPRMVGLLDQRLGLLKVWANKKELTDYHMRDDIDPYVGWTDVVSKEEMVDDTQAGHGHLIQSLAPDLVIRARIWHLY